MTFASAQRIPTYQSRVMYHSSTFFGNGRGYSAQYGALASTNTAWATANKGLFFPFTPIQNFVVTGLWYIGGTATPHSDIGIYLWDGTLLASTGDAASANGLVDRTLSNSLFLRGGVPYYWALALTTTTAGGVHSWGTADSRLGIIQASGVEPLTTGPTFAALAGTNPVPIGGMVIATG